MPMLPALGWYWLVVPLIVALLGVVLVFGGFGHLFRGHPGRGGGRLLIGVPAMAFGLALSLVALNMQSFSRLTYEGNVAEVYVKALDPAQSLYAVTIKRLDGVNLSQVCKLQGDEWEMGARVQKWKPWANTLGLDATYTLDQINNKYFTAARGNGHMITSCDLKGPPPLVNQYVPKSWLFWLFDKSYTEDRRFGSAAYMPLADGAEYRVVMTQAGLNADAINAAAHTANGARP